MVEEQDPKTKIVVVNEHTMGYILPSTPNFVNVLHASILKGAPFQVFPSPMPVSGNNIRLARRSDFWDFRISMEGYFYDEEYEFDRTWIPREHYPNS